ncbi:MAG: glycosyltransferase family 39 protein [Lentisphaerae bacterium]|nr:glycosyltransferase family 39 protein [Lentisphaerota bacterium]
MKKTPLVQSNTPLLSKRRYLFWLYGAFFLALALRLAAAWEIAHGAFASSVFLPHEATDLRTYMDLSGQIAAGEFSGPFYYQPFYYSVFLVLCRWISGGSVWAVIILQALLGAFTALLAGLTAARLSGKRAALIAAYLTALCNILIFYTPFHQIATLQTFNITLLAYLSVLAAQTGLYRYFIAMAAAAAVGALTRGNVLLVFLPLLAVLTIVQIRRKSWKNASARCVVALAVFLLVESPFIIYNSIQLGRLSGPSTAADAVLALGNTPEAPPGGREPGLPAGPMEYPQAYHIWMQDCEEIPVWKKILDYLASEPAAYLELTGRKLLLFWDYREIPNNVALAGEGSTSQIVGWTLPAGIIIALALAGLFLMIKRLRRLDFTVIYLIIIAYWGATAAFYNLSRFRSPLLPLLAVMAGVFAAALIRRSQLQDWRFIRTYGFLTLALGAFITIGAYEFYRNNLEAAILKIVRPSGTVLTDNAGRTVQFYHGPQTFGGWQALEVKSGSVCSVKFPPPIKADRQIDFTEIELSVQASRAGLLSLSVNNQPLSCTFDRPAFKKITVKVPGRLPDDTVTIKINYNSADAVLIADMQRNYQATSFNGETLPGELVIRITR